MEQRISMGAINAGVDYVFQKITDVMIDSEALMMKNPFQQVAMFERLDFCKSRLLYGIDEYLGKRYRYHKLHLEIRSKKRDVPEFTSPLILEAIDDGSFNVGFKKYFLDDFKGDIYVGIDTTGAYAIEGKNIVRLYNDKMYYVEDDNHNIFYQTYVYEDAMKFIMHPDPEITLEASGELTEADIKAINNASVVVGRCPMYIICRTIYDMKAVEVVKVEGDQI